MYLQAFSFLGVPLAGPARIPAESWSWTDELQDPGSISFTIKPGREAAIYGARAKLRPWRSLVAVVDGDQVIAAGPVTRRKWTGDGSGLSVTVGSGMSIFGKRLVLNRALHSKWRNGEVVLDEDNPSPEWLLNFSNLSLAGIANGLLAETLAWGALPIDAPTLPLQKGIHQRSYRGFDFATVLDRLEDLQGVIGGPMMRCAPYRTEAGSLRFKFEPGFAPREFRLSTTLEGHGIILDDVDEDGDSITTEVFALGGRSDDIVLAARERASVAGWPLLQSAMLGHSSVSRITTLQNHVGQALQDGCTVPESTMLTARRSHGIRPGDRLFLTTTNEYHGRGVEMVLNVVQVSGDEGEWVRVAAFPDSEVEIVEAN